MTEEATPYDVGPSGVPSVHPDTLLVFTDPRYRNPTPMDVRALMRRSGLTGSRVGDIVGVDGRTVRKWTGGERSMPYSAWRLLLLAVGAIEGPASATEFSVAPNSQGGRAATAGSGLSMGAQRSITSLMSPRRMGFATKSSMPAARQIARSSVVALAVSATIGIRGSATERSDSMLRMTPVH